MLQGATLQGEAGLLDTSVIIGLSSVPESSLPHLVCISSVTLAELTQGVQLAPRRLDLMIAATAGTRNVPVYTRNAKDLQGIEPRVKVVEV